MDNSAQHSTPSRPPDASIPNLSAMVRRYHPGAPCHGFAVRKAAAVLCLFSLLPVSCKLSQTRNELAKRMAAEEHQGDNKERISELKSDIRGVEKQIEETIESVRDKGTYWRLLGLKYMDYKMWGEAVSALNEAIHIYPEHAFLLYNRALSFGQLSLSADTQEQRIAYLSRAEQGHRRALSIDPRFTPAMYALAILLVFELENPLEARDILENYLELERSDINARFLLARVHIELGENGEALRLYEEIRDIAKNEEDISKANELHRLVERGEYER